MALNPAIFISATSSDLASARDVVAKVLTMMGYTPIWQDIAATDAGNPMEVLRARISPCSAMLQLVGQRFGAAPPTADPQFGCVSYTQYEALYAESIKMPVTYIFLRPNFPTDPCDPEAPELAELQAAYQARLKERGVLRHPAASEMELENRVLRIRDELALIRQKLERGRRRMLWAGALGLILLGLIGWEVWRLRTNSTQQNHLLTTIEQVQTNQVSSIVTLTQTTQKQGDVVAHIDAGVQEILSLPASARADRLVDALVSANSSDLELLSKAGISAFQIQTALAQTVPGGKETVGSSFFDNSRNNPAAIEWLKAALKAGLNPDFLLPDPYWEFRSLLNNALLAGNAPAALALLDAGASPHQYENIDGKQVSDPAFIYPYDALIANPNLSLSEKRKIATSFRDHGAVYYKPPPGPPDPNTNELARAAQAESARLAAQTSEQMLGFTLENTPPLCQQPNTWLLQVAKARGQADWVNFICSMPKTVEPIGSAENDLHFSGFEVRNFLGIFQDKAYFMALSNYGGRLIIEVARDQLQWTIYYYNLSYTDSVWKSLAGNYDPARKEVVFLNAFHYKVTSYQTDQ